MGNTPSGRRGSRRRAAGEAKDFREQKTQEMGMGKEDEVERMSPRPASPRAVQRPRNMSVTGVAHNLREKYKVEPTVLGKGHYGVVRKCQNIHSQAWYAVKSIDKSKLKRRSSLEREIQILRTVHHPNIIELVDVYEDEQFLHLVTELCTGGELFDRIIAKTHTEAGHYTETDAAILVRKIVDAIRYCHETHNICHRDLKPENFLFKTEAEDSELKIIDFGLSRVEDIDQAMTTRVGTPYYIAPEVLSRSYDRSCDMWSIGVISYILLCGYPPFYGNSDYEIFQSVKACEYEYPEEEWDAISDPAKDFIDHLLCKNPRDRMTAEEAMHHEWILSRTGGDAPPTPSLALGGMNNRLRRFIGMNRLKKVALNVIAEQLTEAEIGQMRKLFNAIDADGNGVITLDELQNAVRDDFDFVEQRVVDLMAGIDLDGNNCLDYNEFLAATMERNHMMREENIRAAFRAFDKEDRGHLTVHDLIDIFGSEQHAVEVLGEIDANGDGVISFEEFQGMMQSSDGGPTPTHRG